MTSPGNGRWWSCPIRFDRQDTENSSDLFLLVEGLSQKGPSHRIEISSPPSRYAFIDRTRSLIYIMHHLPDSTRISAKLTKATCKGVKATTIYLSLNAESVLSLRRLRTPHGHITVVHLHAG